MTRTRAGSNAGRPKASRRNGAVSLEFLFGVIILTLLTFAVVEYGIMMLCRHTAAQAATLAAREAAKMPTAATADVAVQATVTGLMGPMHQLPLQPGVNGSGIVVILEYGLDAPIETGDPTLFAASVPPANALTAEDVRVTVFSDMTAGPMINALSAFGADLNLVGRVFRTTSVCQKE
jgi:hypothetical protein